MKKGFLTLTIALLLFSFASAQTPVTYTPMTAGGYKFKYAQFDSGLAPPFITLTKGRGINRPGLLVCNTADSLIYRWTGLAWELFGGGGSVVRDTVDVDYDLYAYFDSTGRQHIARLLSDGLIDGGVVFHKTGFTYGATAGHVVINHVLYTFPEAETILDDADPTFSRVDIFVYDTLGFNHVTGVADGNLLTPQPGDFEIQLTQGIQINPGDTVPSNIVNKIWYDENLGPTAEATMGSVGTITKDFNNTANPQHLTKAIYISSYNSGARITMIRADNDTAVDGKALLFAVYLNVAFGSTHSFRVQFFNGTTPVSSVLTFNNTFGLNPNYLNNYQNIAIPLNAFSWPGGTIFNRIYLTMIGTDNSGSGGLYVDYVRIQSGINQVPSPTDYSNKLDSVYLRNDSLFQYVKGVEKFRGKVTAGGTGTVTNIATGYGLSGGPITTTGTIIVDSAALSLKYLRIVDTTGIRVQPIAGTNMTITGTYPTLTFNASSGSSRTFDTLTVGNDYPRVGVILNQPFSGGSIPTGWTKGSGITTDYTGGKVTITGASSIGAPAAGQPFAPFTSALQYDLAGMPYERLDFQMSIVPTTKSANAIVGVYKGVLGNTIFAQEGIAWDLSNGVNSGKVGLVSGSGGTGGNTVPTFATGADSVSKMNFSTGDSLILYYKKNGWSVTAGIINKTTGQVTQSTFNGRWNGSGGRWNLVFMNGTYVMTNAKVDVRERVGGVVFIGDSQFGGYGNSQMNKRVSDVLFNSNAKYYVNLGLPSLTAQYFDTSTLMTEIITRLQPTTLVIGLGYNDESGTIGAPRTKVYVDTIATRAQAAGIHPVITGIAPRINTATDLYNDSLQNLATQKALDFWDIRTPLKQTALPYTNGAYFYDLHYNDSASTIIANIGRSISGDSILAEVGKDSNYVVKIPFLPNAQSNQTVTLVGRGKNGVLMNVPNTLPTPESVILNMYGTALDHRASQVNAEVHVGGYVRSDTGFISTSVQGLRISFNDYNTSNTTSANINITNSGGAANYPSFDNITGSGNIKMIASSANKAKTGMIGTVSGLNNTLINGHLASTLSGNDNINIGSYNWLGTSGANNIFLGSSAGKGVTTGGLNIGLITANGGSQSLSSSIANSQIYGDLTSYESYASNDVAWNTGAFTGNPNFWFGGRALNAAVTSISLNYAGGQVSLANSVPAANYLKVGRGIGIANPSIFYLQTWDTATGGANIQTSAITKLFMDYSGIAIGTSVTSKAPDAALDIPSTTQALIPPRMTSAQRDAMAGGLLTLAKNAGGSGYTNGNVALSFSGGAGSGAAGYAIIAGGSVSSAWLTKRGTGYTSAPTATLTSGAGTGATFTITIGQTVGATIFCTDCTATDTSTGVMQTWVASGVWKNNW